MILSLVNKKLNSLPSFWVLILFFAASFIVYGNTLMAPSDGGFVFDDKAIVRDRPELRDMSYLPQLLFEPYHNQGYDQGNYRPITMMSFGLNYAFFGEGAAGFHLINFLLHALGSWLIFLILYRLSGDKTASFLTATIFLVLPIHTEAVDAIVGRAEMLSLIFTSLALWMLIGGTKASGAYGATSGLLWAGRDKAVIEKNLDHGGKEVFSNRFYAAIFFLLALLSKESAVGLIPFYYWVLLIFYIKENGFLKRQLAILKKYWLDFIYLTAAFLVFMGLRFATLDHLFNNPATIVENPLKFADPGARILTAAKVLGMYMIRMVWPVNNLSSDYSFNQISLKWEGLNGNFWLGALVLILALGILAYVMIKNVKGAALKAATLAGSVFISFFLITSNILFPIGTIMAERLAYIPSLGVCLLIGLLLGYLWKEGKGRYFSPASLIIFASLVISYGFLAINRNFDWQSEKNLFTDAAKKSPESVLSRANSGAVYLINKNLDGAGTEIEAAQKIYSHYPSNLNNLGLLSLERGELEEAKKQFIFTLVEFPAYGQAMDNLALVYYKKGQYQPAKKYWAILYGADAAEEVLAGRFYNDLIILINSGKREAAKELYEKANEFLVNKRLLSPLKSVLSS